MGVGVTLGKCHEVEQAEDVDIYGMDLLASATKWQAWWKTKYIYKMTSAVSHILKTLFNSQATGIVLTPRGHEAAHKQKSHTLYFTFLCKMDKTFP